MPDGEQLACRLPESEREERRENIGAEMVERRLETRELDDGYAFKYPGDRETLELLTCFIVTENECCPFVKFELDVGKDDKPVWLRLRGSKQIKQMIEDRILE